MSRIIKGQECRWYKHASMWVSQDGKVAAMPRKGGGKPKILLIREDSKGKYVSHEWNGKVSLARAVITCYCPPLPKDGKTYRINFKDGDVLNCSASNLEWIEYHYNHTTSESVVINYYGADYTINRDGTMKKGKTDVPIHDSLFDGDIDCEVAIDPHIAVKKSGQIYPERLDMDDIMRQAGFVNGDDADLKNPKILHIDEDYKNCASDNLLWVEADDSRYKSYLDKKEADKHKRNVDLNPGKELPSHL